MRNKWLWVAIVVVALFATWVIRKEKKISVSEPKQAETTEENGFLNVQNSAEQKTPVQKAVVTTKSHNSTKNYQKKDESPVGRFSLRKLDLPQPASIEDLLNNLTPRADILLPAATGSEEGDGRLDGDFLTLYRGYYEMLNGQLKRIQLDAYSDGINISIEDEKNEYHEWSNGELKFKNYKNDPYGTVILLPNKQVLYVKFYTALPIKISEEGPTTFRAQIGWLLSENKPTAYASRVAMFDVFATLDNPEDIDKTAWPIQKIFKDIFPQVLK